MTDTTWGAEQGEDLRLAEQATLGAAILNTNVATEIMGILNPGDFYDPRHVKVWSIIRGMLTAGEPVDAVTIMQRINAEGQLARFENGVYIHTLIDSAPIAANGTYYAAAVRRASVRRSLNEFALKTAQQASTPGREQETIATAMKALAGIAQQLSIDTLIKFSDLSDSAMSKLEEASENPGHITDGITTGLKDLDELFHGLGPGTLTIIAGRAGEGKSVLLGDIYRAWITEKIPSCMVTLEMSGEEMWRRQIAAMCRINHSKMKTGGITDDEWTRIAKAVAIIDEAPAWIDYRPSMTLVELEALAHRGVEKHGWKGIVVDYSQKIIHRSGNSRENAIAEIAQRLKVLARETGLAVVTGAQLNRESAHRSDDTPRLSDLRESAALEHEADNVILIHRPDYNDKESPRAGEADLVVAKNRAGRCDTVTVAAQLHYQRFVSMGI